MRTFPYLALRPTLLPNFLIFEHFWDFWSWFMGVIYALRTFKITFLLKIYPKASKKLKFSSICSDDRGGFVTPSDHCALCSSKLILEVTHVEDAKQSLVVPKNVPQITDFFSECPLFLWPLCFFEATLGGYKCRGCLVIQLCQEIVLQISWFLFQTILDFFDHCSALCLFRLILDVIKAEERGIK